MITRSKLAEQLRDYQIRSQHTWAPLIIFSPKPQIITRFDYIVALLWAFSVLVLSSYVTFYFRRVWLSVIVVCIGILLPTCLRISWQRRLARKRARRLLLPLSM